MDSSRRPIGPPPSHIISTEIKGDISLYDPQREKVLVLNGTASDVWLLCDGDQTVDGIVDLLAAAYGIDRREIAADVESTVARFIEEGFLKAS